jgi:AAA domain/Bifunctional DNA primase/polymerase, N-terminal
VSSPDAAARATLFAEYARRCAERGFALIRLNGKVPKTADWEKTTPGPAEFAEGQWSRWGERYDMGVVLGTSRPPLAVVEPDSPEAQEALLELLGGELPRAPVVRSGGKSLHLYFLDGGQGNASVNGLELRAGAQQCVLPPSIHPETGRPYTWLEGHEPWAVPLGSIPESLLAHFAGTLFTKTGPAAPVGDEIWEKDPGRHRTLLSIAGTMRRRGLGEAEILAALRETNRRRCRPTPLADEEVVGLVADVVRRYQPAPPDPEREQLEREAGRLFAEWRSDARTEPAPVVTARRKRELQRRPISTVKAEPVEWLIEKRVAVGSPTLVAGVGGLGKSGLLLAWAKQVTVAGDDVLLVSYEDAAAQVIRPRFEALGGKLERLHELYVDLLAGEISFPTDLPELDRHVQETGARMILIDPVSASIDLKLDAHKDQDVRVVLGQLARLAERERLAIVQNAHLNKAPSADPYLRINGSTAFYNAARSVLTVTRDPAEPDAQRLVAHHKSNYGVLGDVERWRVVPVTILSERGPIEVMTMQFVEIAEDVNREDVLASHSTGEEKLDGAVAFLEEALADGNWHDSAGLKKLAAGRISERTLKRAAQELDVEHERRGFPSSTWWRLPQSGHVLPPELGPTGQTRTATPNLPSRANDGEIGLGPTEGPSHETENSRRGAAYRKENHEHHRE